MKDQLYVQKITEPNRKKLVSLIKDINEMSFCVNQGKNISPLSCLEFQAWPQCFGCGSKARLCACCGKALLLTPEVNYCSSCLSVLLEEEKSIQLTSDKKICEKCQKRAVHFSEYNLCLHCTVEKFVPAIFSPNSKDEKIKVPKVSEKNFVRACLVVVKSQDCKYSTLKEKAHLSTRKAKLILQKMEELGIVTVINSGKKKLRRKVSKEYQTIEDLFEQIPRFKAFQAELQKQYPQLFNEESDKRRENMKEILEEIKKLLSRPAFLNLFQKACELVVETRDARQEFLKKELKVPHQISQQLRRVMKALGIIKQVKKTKPAEIFIKDFKELEEKYPQIFGKDKKESEVPDGWYFSLSFQFFKDGKVFQKDFESMSDEEKKQLLELAKKVIEKVNSKLLVKTIEWALMKIKEGDGLKEELKKFVLEKCP